MNIKSCFLRWGIPLLLLAAFLAAVFALNRVDKVALVNREGQTFEKGVVVDILQDNLMPDGSRVGEQRVLVRMTTGVRAGMHVGQDMMGTDSNTLILAFAGGSISMLVLDYAYNLPYRQIINSNNIGIAIMQGLSGSFGIVLAVPVTVALAVLLYTWRKAAPAA